MFVFIAGASSVGARTASAKVVRKSSARPSASRAMVCAVAGATRNRSVSSVSEMWRMSPGESPETAGSAPPGSSGDPNSRPSTGAPETVASASGLTKEAAARVSTTWTRWPRLTSDRTSSGAR